MIRSNVQTSSFCLLRRKNLETALMFSYVFFGDEKNMLALA